MSAPEAVDVLVCGLGFAGATVARALADEGWRVHALERRDHIAGNAFDALDAHGVRIHHYGPHAFHTSAPKVVAFLSRFTAWHPYEHRVRVALQGGAHERLVPFPVNLTTLRLVTGLDLDAAGAARWLAEVREPRGSIRTSEDLVLSTVGRALCELFFRGYTKKHWGLDLSELAVGVAARIPVRTSEDDRYFDDSFQAMPLDGYHALFERMLRHPRISFETGRAFSAQGGAPRHHHLVYTGPIDAFFDHVHGPLPYRSVRFEHEHHAVPCVQPVAQVNHPNGPHPWYRVTEFKHMTGQVHPGTSLVREVSAAEGEPFYPIPRPANEALYQRYRAEADALADVTFVGRLAQYRYYNMDQVVAAALHAARKIDARLRTLGRSPPS